MQQPPIPTPKSTAIGASPQRGSGWQPTSIHNQGHPMASIPEHIPMAHKAHNAAPSTSSTVSLQIHPPRPLSQQSSTANSLGGRSIAPSGTDFHLGEMHHQVLQLINHKIPEVRAHYYQKGVYAFSFSAQKRLC